MKERKERVGPEEIKERDSRNYKGQRERVEVIREQRERVEVIREQRERERE